jgi:pyruvate-ferredoxin/flavodoxin oxidoreductase
MNHNDKLFAYDAEKLAIIKDPRGGSYRHLVEAAELCPAECIHPGTPLNPKEKGVEELIERAKPFN